MAVADAFASEIIKLVRNMSDEAILDLVRERLGAPPTRTGARGRKAVAKVVAAPATRGAPQRKGKRRRRTEQGRAQLLAQVESVVKRGKGLALRDIAKQVGESKSIVAAALRELKSAKRIFQGGDRRFARYAGSAAAAGAAAKRARG